MSRVAEATFFVNEWTEEPLHACSESNDVPRAAHAWMTYAGDVVGEGEASIVFLPTGPYSEPQVSGYVASEWLTVRLHDRYGSFTVQHGGTRTGGRMITTFGRVVEGSGTRELRGLRGTLVITRRVDGLHAVRLEYDFERLLPWEVEAADRTRASSDDDAPETETTHAWAVGGRGGDSLVDPWQGPSPVDSAFSTIGPHAYARSSLMTLPQNE
jgi:hypothetical protein